MKVIYHCKNKKLTEETAPKERKQRYYYRHFKMYVVKCSKVKGETQDIYLEKIGG